MALGYKRTLTHTGILTGSLLLPPYTSSANLPRFLDIDHGKMKPKTKMSTTTANEKPSVPGPLSPILRDTTNLSTTLLEPAGDLFLDAHLGANWAPLTRKAAFDGPTIATLDFAGHFAWDTTLSEQASSYSNCSGRPYATTATNLGYMTLSTAQSLPMEVLSKIFELNYATGPQVDERARFPPRATNPSNLDRDGPQPWSLPQVSSSWRRAALNTPDLWRYISLDIRAGSSCATLRNFGAFVTESLGVGGVNVMVRPSTGDRRGRMQSNLKSVRIGLQSPTTLHVAFPIVEQGEPEGYTMVDIPAAEHTPGVDYQDAFEEANPGETFGDKICKHILEECGDKIKALDVILGADDFWVIDTKETRANFHPSLQPALLFPDEDLQVRATRWPFDRLASSPAWWTQGLKDLTMSIGGGLESKEPGDGTGPWMGFEASTDTNASAYDAFTGVGWITPFPLLSKFDFSGGSSLVAIDFTKILLPWNRLTHLRLAAMFIPVGMVRGIMKLGSQALVELIVEDVGTDGMGWWALNERNREERARAREEGQGLAEEQHVEMPLVKMANLKALHIIATNVHDIDPWLRGFEFPKIESLELWSRRAHRVQGQHSGSELAKFNPVGGSVRTDGAWEWWTSVLRSVNPEMMKRFATNVRVPAMLLRVGVMQPMKNLEVLNLSLMEIQIAALEKFAEEGFLPRLRMLECCANSQQNWKDVVDYLGMRKVLEMKGKTDGLCVRLKVDRDVSKVAVEEGVKVLRKSGCEVQVAVEYPEGYGRYPGMLVEHYVTLK